MPLTKKDAEKSTRRNTVSAIKARHRVLFDEVQKRDGRMAPAIIAAGYAPSMANQPKAITETKSWKALMAEYLPEDKVALRHQELLDKRERRAMYNLKGKLIGYVDEPDTAAVSRALEMAYKLRGSFVPEAPPPGSVAQYNLFYLPEVRASVKGFEDALKLTIAHEMTINPTEKHPADPPPGGGTESPFTDPPPSTDMIPESVESIPEKIIIPEEVVVDTTLDIEEEDTP
jgi:hypothetical protein